MLSIAADIIFFTPKSTTIELDGIPSSIILRPAFKFDEGLLFSGTIKNDGLFEKYLYDNSYKVKIEFPTIEAEAYAEVQQLLKKGVNLSIQNASKIIGKATILDFYYKE